METSALNKLVAAFEAQPSHLPPMLEAHTVIPILNVQPVHQYELWVYILYIITDIESIDILIKGSEY